MLTSISALAISALTLPLIGAIQTQTVAQGWKDLWLWVFAAGMVSFYVLVLVMIPFGFRDLMRLFADLRHQGHADNRDADDGSGDPSQDA